MGAWAVVGGPAVYGGSALVALRGTLIAAAAAEIGRDAAENLADEPATSPEVRRAGVRESVLNPDGTLPGEAGRSPGVRVVEEQEAEQIERSIRERLGHRTGSSTCRTRVEWSFGTSPQERRW